MLSGWPHVTLFRRRFCLLGALCVVFAAWGARPATVAASCGDYLAHHEASSAPVAQGEQPLQQPAPCRGPLCRRSQSPQEAPPPAVVRWTIERWAVVASVELPPAVTGAFATFPAAVQVPSPLADRLERPPRAA